MTQTTYSLCPPASALPPALPCPLCSQPTFEVLAVAVNSGLAAYPTSYTRIWRGGGGAIWRPLAPPGYVAAGDLFTADDEEPELSDMVCLHGEARCWVGGWASWLVGCEGKAGWLLVGWAGNVGWLLVR